MSCLALTSRCVLLLCARALYPPRPHKHGTACAPQAVCTEAGLLALRERRMKVTQKDFETAKERALYKKKGNIPEGLYL